MDLGTVGRLVAESAVLGAQPQLGPIARRLLNHIVRSSQLAASPKKLRCYTKNRSVRCAGEVQANGVQLGTRDGARISSAGGSSLLIAAGPQGAHMLMVEMAASASGNIF